MLRPEKRQAENVVGGTPHTLPGVKDADLGLKRLQYRN